MDVVQNISCIANMGLALQASLIVHSVFTELFVFLVILTSQNGTTPFKGFLIEAVSFYDDSKVYGQFVNLSNYTQHLNCTEVDSVPYKVRS